MAALALVFVTAGAVGGGFTAEQEIPGSETEEGFDTLNEFFDGAFVGFAGTIVFTAEQGVDEPDVRAAMETMFASTARVITAAAAIMAVVFGSFLLEDNRITQVFGVGLAAAIVLDASLVRMLLVPATMELLGSRNWWMPA